MRSCDGCKYCDDIDKVRRNSQFDVIYCDRCKGTFERRMQPWHCPFSPIVNKSNLYQPENCDSCSYSDSNFCNITGEDMMVNTLSFKKVCPMYDKGE